METLYEGCGLLASYLGTLIEGEVLLLTSVISAKLGLFNYYWGLVAAFFGAYTKDWIKFLIVKKQGTKLLEKKPSLKTKIDKASVWYDKRPYFFLTFYRLFYGLSTVILLMSGLKQISYFRFGLHSAISIALWVGVIGGLGYFCAEAMMDNMNMIAEQKWKIIIGLIVVGLVVWFFKHRPNDNHCFKIKK